MGWERIPLQAIHHETGKAYQAPLDTAIWSAIEGPSDAVILEDGRVLGPGNALHDDIRQKGLGRFSFWGDWVYLSASDSSDPRTNKRRYEAWGPGSMSMPLRWVVWGLSFLAACFLMVWVAAAMPLMKSGKALTWRPGPRFWTLLLFAASGSVIPIGLEIGLRLLTPFSDTAWPSVFVPQVGFQFEPNAEVRHTNFLDYWTVSRSNSLGFLDQEPRRIPGACHVTFLGDSFVEAAQVPIVEKVQRLVERDTQRSHPDWLLTSSAFGYSGTGQLNQLPFYDLYARTFSPKLVVLVFFSNDYANNSSILESLRNGWSPSAAPRVFARRTEGTGRFVLTPIAENWREKILPDLPAPASASAHMRLRTESYFYRWAFLSLAARFSALRGIEGPSLSDRIRARVRILRANPEEARLLAGWEDNQAEDLDAPFNKEWLPPLFAEALDATRFAFEEFKRRTDADGARLVVLAVSQMQLASGGRENSLPRLRKMLQELDISLIDQFEIIKARGGDPMAVKFRHDGHWSAQGHRWAADAIEQYLDEHPSICAPATPR